MVVHVRVMGIYDYGLAAQVGGLLRRIPVGEVKRCLRLARQQDLPLSARDLETHHLAGGRIGPLVEALVWAKEHGLRLSWSRAAVQDLVRGRELSVKDWVQDCHRRGLRDLDSVPVA